MDSKFLPEINKTEFENLVAGKSYDKIFELLAEPLHEEMYKRQDFTFMDELSQGQQLLLSYDYVRMQVTQGGFIQFIQNGYTALLLPMPEWLLAIGAEPMSKVLDDVLKVYVLNHEMMDKKTTVEEFALLYEELKEFEHLDDSFQDLNESTVRVMMEHASEHIEQYAVLT
jgi:hypothetical protein